MTRKPVILTFLGRYLPGYKAGGALRTIVNMTEALSDDFRFRIVTSDRDSGDLLPYPSVRRDAWQQVGNADVYYLSSDALTVARCRDIIETTAHDFIYLQSCFSPFTIKPLLATKPGLARAGGPVIVAPRGEFYPGALSIRYSKKMAYLAVARLFRLYAGAIWQASNEEEAAAVRKWFGNRCRVAVAPDIAASPAPEIPERRCKVPGELKVIFLSRICPKKNLAEALRILGTVTGKVAFDIAGPAEDAGYWQTCQKLIAELPPNVKVRYLGTVPHEDVSRVLSEYELFLFPTLGENFGHIILESLLAGCPVLVSDRTPWRKLAETGAGWDLSLDKPHVLGRAVQACIDMDEAVHAELRLQARGAGGRYVNDQRVLAANRNLFMAPPGKG